jgi:hypothetical protein
MFPPEKFSKSFTLWIKKSTVASCGITPYEKVDENPYSQSKYTPVSEFIENFVKYKDTLLIFDPAGGVVPLL